MKKGGMDMDGILNQLYRGEIHPEETYQPRMPELIEVRNAFIKHKDELLAEFDEKTRAKIQDLFDERTLVSSYEIEDAYVQGMQMGARMMAALLKDQTGKQTEE